MTSSEILEVAIIGAGVSVRLKISSSCTVPIYFRHLLNQLIFNLGTLLGSQSAT